MSHIDPYSYLLCGKECQALGTGVFASIFHMRMTFSSSSSVVNPVILLTNLLCFICSVYFTSLLLIKKIKVKVYVCQQRFSNIASDWLASPLPGSCFNIKMSSYQYRDPQDDLPAVLSLTWETPYQGKMVFLLKQGPVSQIHVRKNPCYISVIAAAHNKRSMDMCIAGYAWMSYLISIVRHLVPLINLCWVNSMLTGAKWQQSFRWKFPENFLEWNPVNFKRKLYWIQFMAGVVRTSLV